MTPTFRSHVEAEIASLQARAERLAPSECELERLLAALAVEVEAARAAEDVAAVERLTRRIRVVNQSSVIGRTGPCSRLRSCTFHIAAP